MRIDKGVKPDRPESLAHRQNDQLWDLLSRCWDKAPNERPDIQEIFSELWFNFGAATTVTDTTSLQCIYRVYHSLCYEDDTPLCLSPVGAHALQQLSCDKVK
jgi:hypothetical protein